MNETTSNTTVRQALRTIRENMVGQDYLSGQAEYPCDQGTLMVRNAQASERGSVLLNVFEAELVAANGNRIRKYKV